MIKKILESLLIIVVFLIVMFAIILISFRSGRRIDIKNQDRHVERLLKESYKIAAIPEAILDDDLRLNEIRLLATHNSYHTEASSLQLAAVNFAEPGEAARLRFTHPPLTAQLNGGVRSVELDIRCTEDRFEISHVPLVDNRSHSPLLRPALQELRIWSDLHPEHVPLIVLFEAKNDWNVLNPAYTDWTDENLRRLDALIAEIFGSSILRPSDLAGGWPKLGDSRGRIIFVHHDTDPSIFTEEWRRAEDRVCFLMDENLNRAAGFALRNDPSDPEIPRLIEAGYIVRTRADEGGVREPSRRAAAYESGAQIISTDFPSFYANAGSDDPSWGMYQKFPR